MKKQLLLISVAISYVLPAVTCANDKFQLDGTVLTYDTDLAKDEKDREINWNDVEHFELLLKKNPEISTLKILSDGGLIGAANYLADVVIDYELNTIADRECASACVIIFLAGHKRTLTRGSWLGFHKSHWSSDAIKDYYEGNKGEEEWSNPFEFAEWMYQDTQAEILSDLEYMLERGVSASFAIQTLRADSNEMWYPRRKALVAAGVLNQPPD